MKSEIFIPNAEEFEEMQRKLFKQMLRQELPKIIRAANRKEFLTTKDLKDDFGISHELQQYYRDQHLLSYSQEGRKIWYKTTDVEKFINDRKILRNE
jgi:propanediol utilization protein